MADFQTSLDEHFPGSLPAKAYLDAVGELLIPRGFTAARTLPLLSICRDELTHDLHPLVEGRWGLAFTLAGLGAIPALGRTGWDAGLSHIPGGDEDRGRLLVFGFPHIGIEEDGTVGVTVRAGQHHPTSTCGALTAVLRAIQSDDVPTSVDVDDYEASKLTQRLAGLDPRPTTLVELTIAALDAMETDLWTAIDEFRVWERADVAVCCGVQINAHGERDWIWPRDTWVADENGTRERLTL